MNLGDEESHPHSAAVCPAGLCGGDLVEFWGVDIFAKLHACIVYIGYSALVHTYPYPYPLVAYFCAMSASSLAS
jgi:hypothetical protein